MELGAGLPVWTSSRVTVLMEQPTRRDTERMDAPSQSSERI